MKFKSFFILNENNFNTSGKYFSVMQNISKDGPQKSCCIKKKFISIASKNILKVLMNLNQKTCFTGTRILALDQKKGGRMSSNIQISFLKDYNHNFSCKKIAPQNTAIRGTNKVTKDKFALPTWHKAP